MSLPHAILFDLDDTLIRAYAQPEEAWRRLLHVFSAHLDIHDDAVALEKMDVLDRWALHQTAVLIRD